MLRMLGFSLCLLLQGYTGAGRSVGPPTCVRGREGGGGGVRPFLFSTENSHIVAYSLPSISRPACARPNRRAHAHRASGIAILNSAISCWHPYPIIIGHWQTSGLKLLLLFIPCLSQLCGHITVLGSWLLQGIRICVKEPYFTIFCAKLCRIGQDHAEPGEKQDHRSDRKWQKGYSRGRSW